MKLLRVSNKKTLDFTHFNDCGKWGFIFVSCAHSSSSLFCLNIKAHLVSFCYPLVNIVRPLTLHFLVSREPLNRIFVLKIIKKKTFAGVEIANFKLEIDGWRERWSVINNPKPNILSETLQIQIQIFTRVSIHAVYSYCYACQ